MGITSDSNRKMDLDSLARITLPYAKFLADAAVQLVLVNLLRVARGAAHREDVSAGVRRCRFRCRSFLPTGASLVVLRSPLSIRAIVSAPETHSRKKATHASKCW